MKNYHTSDDKIVYHQNNWMQDKPKFKWLIRVLKYDNEIELLSIVKNSLNSIVNFYDQGLKRRLPKATETRFANVRNDFSHMVAEIG